jgi:hypothetical protein
MSRTNGTLTIHQAHELIQRLEKVGFNSAWAQRIITNFDYAKRILSFIKEGGQQETASQQLARGIMGPRFLGVREVAEYLGVILTTEELERIATVPFKEETLRKYKETHLLFLGVDHDSQGFNMVINRLREMFPRGGNPQFDSYQGDRGSDYLKDFAIISRVKLSWYLIRTDILEESRSKEYDEQVKLLQPNEYLENAVVYVYAKILFFLARGIVIFKNTWARCFDLSSFGPTYECVGSYGGSYGSCSISIGCKAQNAPYHIGIAPAIKPGT